MERENIEAPANEGKENTEARTRLSQAEIEARATRAKELFHAGFNCSQAVVAACADLYKVEEPLALRMAASFGAGIGRMRTVCGAACGMFLLNGLDNGSTVPDPAAKQRNYQKVQALANAFKQEHGSLICAELLGIAPRPQDPTPEARTEAYYHKRPCEEMVGNAVRIYLESL